MKKIIMIVLLFIILSFVGISTLQALEVEDYSGFDYLEYEAEHMMEHQNAKALEDFYSISQIAFFSVLGITIVIFLILALKKKKIAKAYGIIFTLYLIIYIVSNIVAISLNKSMFAVVQVNLYIIIGFFSFAVIFGLIPKTCIRTMIISTVPALFYFICYVIYALMTFVDMEFLVKDLLIGLEYALIIEIMSQIILIPKYISEKNLKDKSTSE